MDTLLKKEITLFGSRFNAKKKQNLYLELSVLLKAGITIRESLTLISENLSKPSDKEIIQSILNDVVNGKSLSDAMAATNCFSEYEFYSIQIGEETGTIAKVVQQLGVFFERKNEQKRIVIAALTYPLIVLTTAVLVIIFMLSYVVPMFQDIFKQNNMELPVLTKMIISASTFVKQYGTVLFLLVGGIVFAFLFSKKRFPKLKSALDYFTLKIPVIGVFVSKVYLAQFTQAVALLTGSKVPLLNSVQMVKKMIEFYPLQNDLQHVETEILKGNSLSKSMKDTTLFNNRIISLVKVAEETNQTEYVFQELNEQFNQEVIQQSKAVSTFLEPVIIIIVGFIVGILLIAMYLPMFQLSSAIG
ncbi:type II secretion system F family protein [uncultured Flavobacterium sp.]|uniref:type II secretion system F family protein n=1 Tax=uncultured Flavobacterium sp. TaxID=165435 RepID=UPI002612EF5D|nr:type II secretion system F family protein [uncultured Flavobacterium sp.]